MAILTGLVEQPLYTGGLNLSMQHIKIRVVRVNISYRDK